MAVRVIKAEPDPSVVKRIVCPQCGVTLEYLPNDVKYSSDGDGWSRATIVCANEECKWCLDIPKG